jgi:hypothetical protein
LGSWLNAAFVLFVALLYALLRCDDNCGAQDWRHDGNAWQWDAIGSLGVVAFVAATISMTFVIARRRRGASWALAAYALAGLSALAIGSSGWTETLGAALAAGGPGLILGVASVKLMPREPET